MIFRAALNTGITTQTKTINEEKKQGLVEDFEGPDRTEGRIHRSVTETCQGFKIWQVWSFKYFPFSRPAPLHH